MRYKDESAPAGSMAITIKIAFVIYATIPVYLLAVEFYRRATFRLDTFGVAFVLIGVLVVCTYVDFVRLRDSEGEGLSPWFSFFQLCVAIAIITIVNLAAGGMVGTYYVLFLLPIMVAAVMGNPVMIWSTWALALTGLGISIFHRSTHAPDTLVWTLAVTGAAWGGAALAIHLAVRQFLAAIRVAQNVSRLARVASEVDEWPGGLSPCMPLLAGILDADTVTVLAGPAGSRLEPVARYDVAPDPEGARPDPVTLHPSLDEGVRQAIDTRKVCRVGRSTFVPNRTASGLDLVIVATRHKNRAVPVTSVTTSVTAGQLVAGMADRVSLIGGLREEAVTDPLTGLTNRRGMNELLDRMLGHAARTGEPFTLVMVDVDHFKDFNDTYGHLAGDAALRSLALLFRSGVRQQDVVARFGGEEFVMLLPTTDRIGATVLVGQLRAAAALLPLEAGADVHPTFSAGIAEWDGFEDRQFLLKRADRALYRAKDAGRDTMATDLSDPGPAGADGSGLAAEQEPGHDADDGHHGQHLDGEPDQADHEVEDGEGDDHHDHAGADHQHRVEQREP